MLCSASTNWWRPHIRTQQPHIHQSERDSTWRLTQFDVEHVNDLCLLSDHDYTQVSTFMITWNIVNINILFIIKKNC
jgi:hypothetical protein